MIYFKLFDTHQEYETYIKDKINKPFLPNVSYCKDADDSHYNRQPEDKLIAIYNITNTNTSTELFDSYVLPFVDEIYIDNVQQTTISNSYQFNTTGEHTVKIKLNVNATEYYDETGEDDRFWDGGFCYNNDNIISIQVPPGFIVTNSCWIEGSAFVDNCSNFTTLILSDQDLNIGESTVFVSNCSNFTTIDFKDCCFTFDEERDGGRYVNIYGLFNEVENLTNIYISPTNTYFDTQNNGNCLIVNDTLANKKILLLGCTSSTIPYGVTNIWKRAFAYSPITNMTIPTSVISINSPFNYKYIQYVVLESTTPPTINANAFNTSTIFYVPNSAVNTYKTATNWSKYANTIKSINELNN